MTAQNRKRPATPLRERIFTLSLYLYPRRFREEFGELMLQAFRDRCRERSSAQRSSVPMFFETMRDLAGSATSEHMRAIQETTQMKQLILCLLLLLGAAVAYKHDTIGTDLLDTVHGYVLSRYQVSMDEAARRVGNYEASIGDILAQRDDARSQLVAAQFFGGDVEVYGHSVSATGDTFKARRAKADKAFARALTLGWTDPFVLWTAVADCPASPAVCRANVALARLTEIDADNAAVWHLEFNAATQAGDSGRARAALAKMAQGKIDSSYEGEAVNAWSAAYDLVPVPADLIGRFTFPDSASALQVIGGRLDERIRVHEQSLYLYYSALSNTCLVAPTDATALRQDCVALASMMAASADSIRQFEGLRLLTLMTFDPDEKTALRSQARTLNWQRFQITCVVRSSCDWDASIDDDKLATWLAAWKRAGSRTLAIQERLRALQLPMAPPDSWPVTTNLD